MLLFAIAMALAIVTSVAGDFFVKQGASRLLRVSLSSAGGAWGLAKPRNLAWIVRQSGILRNGKMMLGIGMLTIHFAAFMMAMRLAPVTVVVPLMACTYIGTTILGRVALGERVTALRWAGIMVIVLGVVVVGISTSDEGSEPPARGTVRFISSIVRAADRDLSLEHLKKLSDTR